MAPFDPTAPPAGDLSAPPLTADEWHVLQRYREVRNSGQGMLVIEFAQHHCTKYEWKCSTDVKLLNNLLNGVQVLRD